MPQLCLIQIKSFDERRKKLDAAARGTFAGLRRNRREPGFSRRGDTR
jgi:hypothetical protein